MLTSILSSEDTNPVFTTFPVESKITKFSFCFNPVILIWEVAGLGNTFNAKLSLLKNQIEVL